MTPSHSALAGGPEFDAIRMLLERWGTHAHGIGDDAAVSTVTRGNKLLSSVDACVEGRHFRREWLSPREIGYRAVTAALSDLAAMAARATGVLIALGVPPQWMDAFPSIADGIGDAVEAAGTVVRGGNISAAGELSITTTVFGEAFTPLLRTGASAGHHVYVTGRLGAPGAALRRLLAAEQPGEYRERFARPVARLDEARWLAAEGATACIDISDGLIADLEHLAAASGVTMDIAAAAVPCVHGIPAREAMMSGEEYELVVTSAMRLPAPEFETRFGIPLTEIGVVQDILFDDTAHEQRSRDERVIVRAGRVANLSGHDHLSA